VSDDVAALRRQLAERDAALRELRAIIARALPDRRRGRYDDPDDVVRRLNEAGNANARQR
jgi:hypothetical protein